MLQIVQQLNNIQLSHTVTTYAELARYLKAKGYRIGCTNVLQSHCETWVYNAKLGHMAFIQHDTEEQFIADVLGWVS